MFFPLPKFFFGGGKPAISILSGKWFKFQPQDIFQANQLEKPKIPKWQQHWGSDGWYKMNERPFFKGRIIFFHGNVANKLELKCVDTLPPLLKCLYSARVFKKRRDLFFYPMDFCLPFFRWNLWDWILNMLTSTWTAKKYRYDQLISVV